MKNPFTPPLLPPDLKNIFIPDLVKLLGEANRSLARLGELPHILPDTDHLAAPLLRKEAVSSSAIEGTQTTLAELYKHEANILTGATESTDAKEVENYVKALHKGMQDVKNFGLSTRVLKAMHKVLMTGVRNEQGVPGEYRDFPVHIAPKGTPIEQATFVPPSSLEIDRLMKDLENYMNNVSSLEDPIIQCALAHYQFEAIHPFGDGNGRIGRLLIPLLFYHQKVIAYPLIYVSEFFERDRKEYYARLLAISETGDWDGWIKYFLRAIKNQSELTYRRGEAIIKLYKEHHDLVRKEMSSSNSVALVDHIFHHPYTAAPFLAFQLKVNQVTAMRLLERFATLGILKRSSGKYRKRKVRVFGFTRFIEIINS